MQPATKTVPNPYAQGGWLSPDQVEGARLSETGFKGFSDPVIDPFARGDWLSPGLVRRETAPSETSSESTDELEKSSENDGETRKPPKKDLVLRGPIWNYNRIPQTNDGEHYDYLLYRKLRSSLFAAEDFILKGKPWQPRRPVTRSFIECLFGFIKNNDPDAEALLEAETGRTMKFSEVVEKAKFLSAGLRWIGLMPGQIVAIVSYNSLEAIMTLLATWLSAGIPAPVDSTLNPVELGKLLRIVRPRLVFSEGGKTLAKVETALGYLMTQWMPQVIVNTQKSTRHWTVDRLLRPAEPMPPEARGRFPERPTLVMFTSGVTGTAKAALLPERYFTDCTWFMDSAFTAKTPLTSCTVLITGPIFWASPLYSMMVRLSQGQRVVFYRGPPTVPVIVDSFRKYSVLVWFTSPSNLLHLLHWPVRPRIPSLKTVFVSGASFPLATYLKVRDELFEKKVDICILYGMAEAGPIAVNLPKVLKAGSIGRLFNNVQLKVVDKESGLPLGPNEEGMMCFKSPTMMLGYYDNPEATAEAFDAQGFLRSGDLGYYDKDGWLYFVDRQKELIKWQNYHVHPTEVEEHLLVLPAVKEAAVVGIPDKMDGEIVAAAVVLNEGFDVAPVYLEHFANGRISDNKRIRAGVYIFPELPKTAAGKPHKPGVRQMIMALISEQANAPESIYQSQASETEQ